MVNGDSIDAPMSMDGFDADVDRLSNDRVMNRFTIFGLNGKRVSIIYRHIVSIEEL
jgi:hypothetical protein